MTFVLTGNPSPQAGHYQAGNRHDRREPGKTATPCAGARLGRDRIKAVNRPLRSGRAQGALLQGRVGQLFGVEVAVVVQVHPQAFHMDV